MNWNFDRSNFLRDVTGAIISHSVQSGFVAFGVILSGNLVDAAGSFH